MKKIISALCIMVFVVSLMGGTAFAHGKHGSHHKKSSKAKSRQHQTVCTRSKCKKTGAHRHGGTWYRGQAGQSGDYAACALDGCTVLGLHEHDGTFYYCQNHELGCEGCRVR